MQLLGYCASGDTYTASRRKSVVHPKSTDCTEGNTRRGRAETAGIVLS